jgi:dTDP-4-amino-4,6-dideoxygalactose transaminase
VSLPMHPYLSEDDQDRIVSAARDTLSGPRRVAAE